MKQGREWLMVRMGPVNGEPPRVDYRLTLDFNDPSDSYMGAFLSRGMCYEPEVAAPVMRILRPGDIAIDVGASIGFFTVMMSQCVGAQGKVIAFEPHPETREILQQHVELNGCTNVDVMRHAVAERCRPIDFYFNSDMKASSAIIDPGLFEANVKTRANPQKIEVPAVTLGLYCHMPVRLIKIDTEGAELLVLQGGAELFETRHPPFIIVELNPFGLKQCGQSIQEMRQYMLKNFGYDFFLLRSNGGLPIYVPPKIDVHCLNDVVVANGMFSTLKQVEQVWSTVLAQTDEPQP